MPVYEYVCEEPGKKPLVIELIRSATDADKPVEDPEGKGRTFRRRLSVFATGGGASAGTSTGHTHSATCGCGKPRGSCGMA